MAAQIVNIQVKRGLAANLTALTLLAGEFAYATDTKKLYIGGADGDKIEVNKDAMTSEEILALLGTAASRDVGTNAGNLVEVDGGGKIDAALIPDQFTLGTAGSKDVGTAEGNVPVIGAGGKLDVSLMPEITITSVKVVDSEAAMLALDFQPGDVAIRSDESKTYILAAEGASVLSNWLLLPTPTDAVISVNGKTGVVVITKADIGLDQVDNKSAAAIQADAVAAAMNIVTGMNYISTSDVIDGGTF